MARPSIASAAADWLKAELLGRALGRRRKVVQIDYAQLCRDLRASFDGLCAELSLSNAVAPQWLGANGFLPGERYHSLNGNPDRFDRGPVTVSLRDPRWSAVPRAEQPLIRAVAHGLRLAAPART